MIKVKDIASVEYRDEVRLMYEGYYHEILGEDWTSKIPVRAIRDFLNSNKTIAKKTTEKLYGDKKTNDTEKRIALGVFDEDILIGFACIAIFDDNVGGVYHIYVKPEYRKSFISSMKDRKTASQYLIESIDEYFKARDINSVILEVPHTVSHLQLLVKEAGFRPVKVHYDAVEFHRP